MVLPSSESVLDPDDKEHTSMTNDSEGDREEKASQLAILCKYYF